VEGGGGGGGGEVYLLKPKIGIFFSCAILQNNSEKIILSTLLNQIHPQYF